MLCLRVNKKYYFSLSKSDDFAHIVRKHSVNYFRFCILLQEGLKLLFVFIFRKVLDDN